MAYQWDKNKAAINLHKHGIDFADAVSEFSDDLSITVSDDRFDEERFNTIWMLSVEFLWWRLPGAVRKFG
jgi:uncharacterized protein